MAASLTRTLREALAGSVVFKHSDPVAGVPDVSVTWGGATMWLELKLLKRGRGASSALRGVQHLTCGRLARAGECFYVAYHEPSDRTLVLPPADFAAFLSSESAPLSASAMATPGWKPRAVAEWVRERHLGWHRRIPNVVTNWNQMEKTP